MKARAGRSQHGRDDGRDVEADRDPNATASSPRESRDRLGADMRHLSAAGFWCSPEFIIQASRRNASTEQARPEAVGDEATSAGRHLATRALLASPAQVAEVVEELRGLLDARPEGKQRKGSGGLLEVWMLAERCLTLKELDELRPVVLERLFPDQRVPAGISRDGSAQLGGA